MIKGLKADIRFNFKFAPADGFGKIAVVPLSDSVLSFYFGVKFVIDRVACFKGECG